MVVKVGDVARIDVRFLLSKECIVEDLVVVVVSELVVGAKATASIQNQRSSSHHRTFQRPFLNAYFLCNPYFEGIFPMHTFFEVKILICVRRKGAAKLQNYQLPIFFDAPTMAKAWCTLKPKAKALVGVPYGPDVVQVLPIQKCQLFPFSIQCVLQKRSMDCKRRIHTNIGSHTLLNTNCPFMIAVSTK